MQRSQYPITAAMLAATLFAPALAQHGALDAETLFERLSPSVWVVFAKVDKGTKQGSAVVIDEEVLVTNCHVVDKASKIGVANGTQELPATLQYADHERDLCFLSVPRLKAPAVQIGDPHALRVGARLYALGNPRGLELTLSDGLLSASRRNARGELQVLQISVPISPGSSGGGLFNVYGQLVGITTFGYKESQSLNFAMPSHFLLEVPLRTAGVKSTLVVHAPPKAPERAPVALPGPSVIVAAAPAPASPPGVPAPAAAAPTPPVPAAPAAPAAPAVPAIQPEERIAAAPPPVVATPLPPPVAIAAPTSPPAAGAHPVSPPAQARATPIAPGFEPREGRVYQYRLTDRTRSIVSVVEYRVQQVTANRAIFNEGGRVENLAGEVIANASPIGGEADSSMPPGGWVKPGTAVGQKWPLKYKAAHGNYWVELDLVAHAVSESELNLAGTVLKTLRVEFEGFNERGSSRSTIVLPASRYRATAWYAPDLQRIVKFEARTRGGTGTAFYYIDEVLELVSVK